MPVVVILDDRTTNQTIFARLAASIDIEEPVRIRTFGNPGDALAWLAGNQADLVITDFKMPEMDGAEFTRALRQMPGGADVPVMVITAYEDHSFRMRALEAGATDFLQSPVDHFEFRTRTRNLLKLREQQQIIRRRANALELELRISEESRQELLRDSHERLIHMVDTIPAMLSATNAEGRYVFVNAFQAEIAGASPADFVDQDRPIFGEDHRARGRALDRIVFETGRALPGFEEEITVPDGERRTLHTTKSPLRSTTGQVTAVLTTSLDITDQKLAEESLRYLAAHDGLTGLLNRASLHSALQNEIARGRRGNKLFALHFIDLDHFKSVNDGYGHHIGDGLLRQVAERLRGIVPPPNQVARLGGDEFAILQTEMPTIGDAATMAEAVLAAFAAPFLIEDEHIQTSASIGITLHPKDGGDAVDLLKNADIAMYRAKVDGRACFRVFASDTLTRTSEASALATDLRDALARQQFTLLYQPQLDLRSGVVSGAEALLRWMRPGAGQLNPSAFLSIAEESGLIVPINNWVLLQACRQAAAWRADGALDMVMAVNLSPAQLRRQDIGQLVRDALAETGLSPCLLELELTEGILLESDSRVATQLHELRQLGVRIAVDDFGAAHTSFNHLRRMPVSRLKIDRSFIRDLRTLPNDGAIVGGMIGLGHALNIDVVAEGVETAEQLALLRDLGCDVIQGHHFSRPLTASAMRAMLDRHTATETARF